MEERQRAYPKSFVEKGSICKPSYHTKEPIKVKTPSLIP